MSGCEAVKRAAVWFVEWHTSMCTSGKEAKKSDDRCIVWELHKRILFGKISKGGRMLTNLRKDGDGGRTAHEPHRNVACFCSF